MNFKQGFGIFIVILMIGSILGFTTYFNNGDNQNDTGPDINPDLPDSTTIQMSAENVNAKVVEILPKILFSGFTNEADISVLDKKIASIKGVYRIDSKYRQAGNSSFGTSLVYVAEISFDKDVFVEEMVSAVNSSTENILFDPFSYEIILASIPKNIKFSNEQGFDLDYEFVDPLNLVYVLPGTQKADELLIRIDGYFTGQTLVSSVSSVLNNLTAEPRILSFDLTKPIEEKLPVIVFGSFVEYSYYLKDEVLKAKIIALDSIADVNVFSYAPENYFVVFFDANNSLQQDFNELLSDNNYSVNSIEVSAVGDSFSAKIGFTGEDISVPKNAVITFLESKNATNISVDEPKTQAFGSIELTSPDSIAVVSELSNLFNSLNFTGFEVQQKAVVLFDSFTDENEQEFIPDQDTTTEVFIKPSRTVGEEVLLKIEVQVSRNKIISIAAAEE